MKDKENLIVIVDSDLKREFRIRCITKNKNMTDVITELIKEYLKKK